MLLEEGLQLVTFQEGILFNKSERKRSISYCTDKVMNDLNGHKCEIMHYKGLENTSKIILDTKNKTFNIPRGDTFWKLPATLIEVRPKCQASQLIFRVDFVAFTASLSIQIT